MKKKDGKPQLFLYTKESYKTIEYMTTLFVKSRYKLCNCFLLYHWQTI